MLQPVGRRTWDPLGQTPIEYNWDHHDRLSAVSALTLSPERHRMGLYFQLHMANVHALEMIASQRSASPPAWQVHPGFGSVYGSLSGGPLVS